MGTVVGVASFVEGGFVGLGLDDYDADGSLLEFPNDNFAQKGFSEFDDLLSEELSGQRFLFCLIVVLEHFAFLWHLCQ